MLGRTIERVGGATLPPRFLSLVMLNFCILPESCNFLQHFLHAETSTPTSFSLHVNADGMFSLVF